MRVQARVGVGRDRDAQRGGQRVAGQPRHRRRERDPAAGRRADRDRAVEDRLLGLAGAGDQSAVSGDDLALAAVRDAAQLDSDLVGGDERHAVLARADRDHQVGLNVFQRLRVAAAGDPGGRHDEHLGAALDQRAADGRDAAVGADEDAQPAERRLDRFERGARPEPAPVEVPQEALVGPARDAVGGDDVGAVGQALLAAACAAVHDRRPAAGCDADHVSRRGLQKLRVDRLGADHVPGNGSLGHDDQARAVLGGGGDLGEQRGPPLREPRAVVRTRLHRCDGCRTNAHLI